MGAVDQAERTSQPSRQRGLAISVAVAAGLVVLALLTKGGGGPEQRLSAGTAPGATSPRGAPVTFPGGTPAPAGSATTTAGAAIPPGAPGAAGVTGGAGATQPGGPAAIAASGAGGGASTTAPPGGNGGSSSPSASTLPDTTGGSSAGANRTPNRISGVDGGVSGSGAEDPSARTTVPATKPDGATGSGQLIVTEADSGKTFSVAKGGTVTLQLAGAWLAPVSDGPALRKASDTTFAADAAGTAHITACRNTITACGSPDFTITVNVVA